MPGGASSISCKLVNLQQRLWKRRYVGMEDEISNGQRHKDEDIRHVAEMSFDNPVYRREDKSVMLKEQAFDYSVIPHSVKFLDHTNARKRRKIAYVCALWLLLIVASALVIVLVAFSVDNDDEDGKTSSSSQIPSSDLSHSIRGDIHILNKEYDPMLADMRSKQYRTLAASLLEQLGFVVRKSEIYSEWNQTIIESFSPSSTVLHVTFLMTFTSSYDVTYLEVTMSRSFEEQLHVTFAQPQWVMRLGEWVIDEDWQFTALQDDTSDESTNNGDKCLPIDSRYCHDEYSETTFPNYLDHQSASVANAFLTRVQTVVESGCYGFAQRFLCAVAIPKCIENSRIPPCRQMCEDFFSKCRSRVPEGLHFIDCDIFPNTLCIGAPELSEVNIELTPTDAVRLQLHVTWYTVCGQGFSQSDGHVICTQLDNSNLVRTWTSENANREIGSHSLMMNCKGDEQHVAECELLLIADRCEELAHVECSSDQVTDVSIRLSGTDILHERSGSAIARGRLEVQYRGSWGTVCNDGFDTNAVQVACRSLGFSDTNIAQLPPNTFPISDLDSNPEPPIWLDNVACLGHETSLLECRHNAWGDHNCDHNEDVMLDCDVTEDSKTTILATTAAMHPRIMDTDPPVSTTTPLMDQFDLRLSGGPDELRGRVEVLYNATWGTVCNSMFDNRAAMVLCRQMQYRTGSYEYSRYGPGSGPIWLTQVVCQGHEENIRDCYFTLMVEGETSVDCTHRQDVSIACV